MAWPKFDHPNPNPKWLLGWLRRPTCPFCGSKEYRHVCTEGIDQLVPEGQMFLWTVELIQRGGGEVIVAPMSPTYAIGPTPPLFIKVHGQEYYYYARGGKMTHFYSRKVDEED